MRHDSRTFGAYGGRYVPEILMEPLRELEAAYAGARRDPAFGAELAARLRDFVGRPTPLTHAERLSESLGCRVWLKREDLNHTGAHKINNAMGQALLVRRWQAGLWRRRGKASTAWHGIRSRSSAWSARHMGRRTARKEPTSANRASVAESRPSPAARAP